METGAAPAVSHESRFQRILRARVTWLCFVLLAAFGYLIGNSTRALYVPRPAPTMDRLYFGLGYELLALTLVAIVLRRNPDGWKDLKFTADLRNILVSLVLVVCTFLAFAFTYAGLAFTQVSFYGRFVPDEKFHIVLELGLSLPMLLFLVVNPVFEELIVRGFLIREVTAASGSTGLAIFASAAIQASYHTYQGLRIAVAHFASFLVLSIYYAYSRKLTPVILAHFYMDLFGFLMITYHR